jgi:hypothetical protein
MFAVEASVTLELAGKGIRDEELHDSAPLVRALVVQRYEQIWSTVEPHVTGEVGKPDPRFIEAGIRVLKELTALYRLHAPVPGADQPQGELVAPADLVLAGLRELEARMRDS